MIQNNMGNGRTVFPLFFYREVQEKVRTMQAIYHTTSPLERLLPHCRSFLNSIITTPTTTDCTPPWSYELYISFPFTNTRTVALPGWVASGTGPIQCSLRYISKCYRTHTMLLVVTFNSQPLVLLTEQIRTGY